MISCTFNGRLGNHLFPIATSLSLAKKLGEECIFPNDSYAGHRGNVKVNLSMFKYNFKRGVAHENSQYSYHEDAYKEIPLAKNTTISGFYQDYRYFDDIRDELLNKYFIPTDEISEKISKTYISPNSLGISVRRGDYLMLQNNHCVLSEKYYSDAINTYFQSADQLFVFSDDFNWCKQTFGNDAIYVNDDIGTQLFMMSKMKHLILSNSTFAWWGAYLNNNNGTIIMPDPWYGPSYYGKEKGLVYPKWTIHKHTITTVPFTVTADMFN
jgi:hypothetical protein